jgi:signal transduction histidine kinase/CheY-like chemotaxis protein
MRWLQNLFPNEDSEFHELMRSTARNIVYSVSGLYMVWHIFATLFYPQRFSPSLWLISLYMLGIITLTLYLFLHRYLLAQAVWQIGLIVAILLAYIIYKEPNILLALAALPLIVVVSLGTPLTVLMLIVVNVIMATIVEYEQLPKIYNISLLIGSTFSATFGWGISSNLLSALNSASYHYHEMARLLEETQNHRAEVSRLLKDRNQFNYQLERTNEMLTFARAQAEEARENRNRFMLAVSHELRSPLNFIIGFSDVMVKAPETYMPLSAWPPGLYEDMQEIYISSQHLMRLINDILDMGKIEARQMLLYREKAQVEQIVADVRTLLESAFAKKKIALRTELPPNLPTVFVDTTRLRQVLLNLMNNGLRFTEHGNVTLRVRCNENDLIFSVTDTGPGIALEDLPKIFEEFRQVGEENWQRHSGTGLGLYISRQFVRLHGGDLRVESTLGQGTRFEFNIPLDFTAAETDIRYNHSKPAPCDNRLVLLVTPDTENGSTIQRELDGYILQTISDIPQALEKARQLFPRAILVNSAGSSLNPVDLPYDLPVVHFSLPSSGEKAGNVVACLTKPIPRQTLIESLPAGANSLLVVDNDPVMLRLIRQTLHENKTSQILGAFTGVEALEMLEKHTFHAILLDLELPDMTGWEWLARLQEKPHLAALPVIIMSAQDLTPVGSDNLEVQLKRPLSLAELGRMLKAVLENIHPQYPVK